MNSPQPLPVHLPCQLTISSFPRSTASPSNAWRALFYYKADSFLACLTLHQPQVLLAVLPSVNKYLDLPFSCLSLFTKVRVPWNKEIMHTWRRWILFLHRENITSTKSFYKWHWEVYTDFSGKVSHRLDFISNRHDCFDIHHRSIAFVSISASSHSLECHVNHCLDKEGFQRKFNRRGNFLYFML